jgi:hypothetical protein
LKHPGSIVSNQQSLGLKKSKMMPQDWGTIFARNIECEAEQSYSNGVALFADDTRFKGSLWAPRGEGELLDPT